MKVIIAMDSFKGSLTTLEVGNSVSKGILKKDPHTEILHIPMADGGEGTLDTILSRKMGKRIYVDVEDPLGRIINASYGILEENIALIEMATASGLTLLSPLERDPRITSSYGTGQLILDALNRGCRKFYIAIGGSATNDAGAGMAEALGARLLDGQGKNLPRGGHALKTLSKIDLVDFDPRIALSEFVVLSDVDNPLCGNRGASAVYGPQKGATLEMVHELDEALNVFGQVSEETFDRPVIEVPGAGAAGGLGAGLLGFCDATLQSGVEAILDIFEFEALIEGADLIITGEGQIDRQTLHGKVPVGVAKRAKAKGVPVIAIVGSIGDAYEGVFNEGIEAVFSIVNGPMTLEVAMERASILLEDCAFNVMKTFGLFQS